MSRPSISVGAAALVLLAMLPAVAAQTPVVERPSVKPGHRDDRERGRPMKRVPVAGTVVVIFAMILVWIAGARGRTRL